MLKVTPLPAFNDNYIWLLQQPGSSRCWVVDPGQAEPVQRYLAQHELQLEGILLTHHHPDHIGGVKALASEGVTLVGCVHDVYRLPPLSQQVAEGSRFQVLGETVQVLEVPGHTLGHIAYLFADHQPPLLFCGDTLFSAGCGRLFEGTAEQMHTSLQRLCQLPGETQIYPAHEYTQANLRFAAQVEPDNDAMTARITQTEAQRNAQTPTLPVRLSEELTYNPFLRVSNPLIRQRLEQRAEMTLPEDSRAFAVLRAWKDEA
ncbi:hydroxyacylglutathione hydrolase [Terasakiispira papahanaumokuakeensis]|uniref:Hydroxyacylglutathione hydrolase n=2 Tax=Terasakiispira papahanaumokuakeensis TaxID=197479 RepID=A0A1E2V7E9_9GAMM|nr:hydroxyacylglutathione hydrolase [Terasakiispira papahanaumokuakeensis]